MQYSRFIELLNKGETKNIDFKILSNAFIKGHEKDTAELVKDIIALSNNGYISSYLIIGVSDDRTGFLSVDNDKLTDDNLQTLCKDNIFPIPRVKLTKCKWKDATDVKHNDKEFVIIQVGPQARQCFRFLRDYIDYDKKYCFRKHEVWIRRGATSDLASPEEIRRLLEGREPIADVTLENNFEYTRVTLAEARQKIIEDLDTYIKNVNGKITEYKVQNRRLIYYSVSFEIADIKLRLGIFIMDKCDKRNNVLFFERLVSNFDNGLLLITLGNVSQSATEMYEINIKEDWGRFCIESSWYSSHYSFITDDSKRAPQISCFVIDKVINTTVLYKKISALIKSIEEKDDINDHIYDNCTLINERLMKWRDEDCPEYTGKNLYDPKKGFNMGSVRKLDKEEYIEPEKYGNRVLINNKEAKRVLNTILETKKD